ncbi:hypothetical protein CEXT_294821 [Caerostris extrusa]|uniref:Uncharacterized protein n=1 Tax=Caerostris extrusa TaxID=172846 RepID=A0AAV4PH96_CAEEX|nr:hypothetical protein CEXT_294821 [Caerostris extrusa]
MNPLDSDCLTVCVQRRKDNKKTSTRCRRNCFLLTSKASRRFTLIFLLRPVSKEISPITIDPLSPKKGETQKQNSRRNSSGNGKTCLDSRNQSMWASLIPCFQAEISWADEVYMSFLNASTQDFY